MSAKKMCKLSLLALIKTGKVEEATDMLLMEPPTLDELHKQGDSDGDALFWASCRGYTLIVELLLTLGSNVCTLSQSSGATSLHAAADNGNKDVLKLLLKWGADPSSRNSFQDTPCHLAAYRGHSKCVAVLLKAGTRTHLRNKRQNTVLDEAKYGQLTVRNGEHTLVQHLLYAYEHSQSYCGERASDSGEHLSHSSEHLSHSGEHLSHSGEHVSYLGKRYALNQDYVHRISRRSDSRH